VKAQSYLSILLCHSKFLTRFWEDLNFIQPYFCSVNFLRIRHLLIIPLCFSALFGAAQNATISGYVKDKATGESILGASVYVKELNKGAPTNLYGFYSVTYPAGQYTLVVSFLGYTPFEQSIDLQEDVSINVELGANVIETEGVEIIGEKSANTESTDMGRTTLEVEKIKTLPAFLGEVDILKTIQFLPGVQTASEGNSGFYVRGGGPDQNLILIDNATVYNAAHLFGFFSIFNADAVKNIEIIKGGMPANYGGRLASVLDISLKEGNLRDYNAEGGIGLISSRLTAQGPIKKDVSSFIVSGRRTYIDVLLKPFINPESNFAGSSYFFYDLNAKINYRLSDKDQLFLSGYFGRDVFSFSSQQAGFSTDIPWGNAIASARWNHLFNDRLFMNTIVTFSDYRFEFGAQQSDFEFRLFSGIKDWSAKSQLSFYPSLRHSIKAGVDYVFHEFTPSSVTARSGETTFDTGDITKLYSHEAAAYVMDEFDINENLRVNGGLRLTYFVHVGPYTRYTPNNVQDQFSEAVPPTIDIFSKGEPIKDYVNLEPRLALRWKLNKVSSIKAGYTQNYQYVHLTSLSATSLPTDVWYPSTDRVEPQFGTQYSIGYFRNFFDNAYESSVEIYYKDMDNLVEYKEGTLPEDNVNDNIDNLLTFGRGYSYGAEFFFKKRYGAVNGWLGYTWSKTMRVFEEINDGDPFPAKFDRRHDFSIVMNYTLNDKWTFGGAFVYATGNAITLPVQRYFIEGQVVDVYGDRNSFRMDPYHRADVSVTLTPSKFKDGKDPDTGEVIQRERKIFSSWTLSVYNLYNRQNPYFLYFGNEGDLSAGTLEIKAYQVSLFPILPSITWNFKF
jgi:hypothetical protein